MAVKIKGKSVSQGQYEDHLMVAPQKVVNAEGFLTVGKSGAKGDPLVGGGYSYPANGLMGEAAAMGSVHVVGSRTINMGNYESMKIECGLTMPCTKATLEEAYTFCVDWVSDKIESAVNEAKA